MKPTTISQTSVIAALCVLLTLCGCGGEQLTPQGIAARKSLQFARPQEALDKLSEGAGDATAEGHYLRAFALEQLNRNDAAKAEIKLALDAAPKNPKYKGYSLRLKLFDRDDTAIEALLELHDQNPSSAAVSLYAIFAYQAKHVRQRSDMKLRAARMQLENAQTCLKTALSLAAQIPECHRELLGMAVWFEQPDDAIKLVDALLHEEPDNVEFQRDRIKVLLLAKQYAETITAATALYKRLDRTEEAAFEFANILNRLPPSPAALQQYDMLREHFPTNTSILLRYCWSLGKAGRSKEACEELAKAIKQQTDPHRRRMLARSIVAIPLEAGDEEIAAEQLQKFGKEIRDDQVLTFFEGELAALRKDYTECVEKMQEVVNIYRTESSASPELAHMALGHIQRMLAEQQLAEQLRKAAELTLRRSGIGRFDAVEVRKEAQSLLNLMEVHDRPPTARPKTDGIAVPIPNEAPLK